MKSKSIFGCTGSIGTQALEILRQNKEQFSIDVFVCNSNTDKALEIVNEFNPEHIFMSDAVASNKLTTEYVVLGPGVKVIGPEPFV